MIDDSKLAQPRFKGLSSAVTTIVREDGILGLYRGLGPTVSTYGVCLLPIDGQIFRQGANGMVRLTTYSTLKQLVQGNLPPGTQVPSWMTFSIGALAGTITVCTYFPDVEAPRTDEQTRPCPLSEFTRCAVSVSGRPLMLVCSVVKTRMQSLSAKTEYRNAFHCAYRIATEEGILRFWKGTVPRLGRLVVSCRPRHPLKEIGCWSRTD